MKRYSCYLRGPSISAVLMCCCLIGKAQIINDNTQKMPVTIQVSSDSGELIAHNMLLYQRNAGGWPKHVNDKKIDYTKRLSAAQKASIKDDSFRNDATIDNEATVKEIRFLARQYKLTGKKPYLNAVEKGLLYLIKAQYANGGWPQFFPDTSGYKKHITYNDNAMVNVLNLLQDVSLGLHYMDAVDKLFIDLSKSAVEKGIECILNTQVKVNGKLTAWCAQHDKNTLLPVKARSYELISLSGMESVGIVEFLIRQKNPLKRVKLSVAAAVEWLKTVQLNGYKYGAVTDSSKSRGFDRVLLKDPESVIWARCYDIDTNEPFVSGRDGNRKKDIQDIDYERRVGYAWYGAWAKKLLEIHYPAWAASNLTNNGSPK